MATAKIPIENVTVESDDEFITVTGTGLTDYKSCDVNLNIKIEIKGLAKRFLLDFAELLTERIENDDEYDEEETLKDLFSSWSNTETELLFSEVDAIVNFVCHHYGAHRKELLKQALTSEPLQNYEILLQKIRCYIGDFDDEEALLKRLHSNAVDYGLDFAFKFIEKANL